MRCRADVDSTDVDSSDADSSVVRVIDLGPLPRRSPLDYPGRALPGPALVEIGGVTPAAVTPLEVFLSSTLAQSVAQDGTTLAETLERLGQPPLEERKPVLGIGSNASVAQMAHKFVRERRRFAYPQFIAEATGLDVGYAPIVAGYGAVPATAVPRPGATVRLAVQFLDAATVALLDATEGGYDRVKVEPSQGVRVVLPNGDVLASVDVYVAREGYLSDEDGPWLLGAGPGPGPGRRDQRWVMARLLGATGADDQNVDALVERLVTVPADPVLCADGASLAELLRRGIDTMAPPTPSPYLR